MKITQLMTPISKVHWLTAGDIVGDAFDHLETYEVNAVPVVDWSRRYLGTVTEADLRRHVARHGRAAMRASTLADVERRSTGQAVAIDADVTEILDAAVKHHFVAVIDATGKLAGIVERHRLIDTHLPRAA